MSTRRKGALVVIPLLALLGLIAVAATTPEPLSPRGAMQKEADAWVLTHKDSLPSTLAAISERPIAYRKAIYRALSITTQERLWKEQLEGFLLEPSKRSAIQRRITAGFGGSLNERQRALVEDALGRLPTMFDSTLKLEQRQAITTTLCERSKTVFSLEQSSLVFGTLGARDASTIGVASHEASMVSGVVALIRTGARLAHLVPPAKQPYCGCLTNTGCPDCGSNEACFASGMDCIPTHGIGCGCFYFYGCDGYCM